MVKIIINLRIRVAFRRTVSWHSSVIIGIAHDPVKEKDHFDQQEWPAASYSAITTGPSRDSLALWVGVLEHLRAHGWEWETAPKQETRRRRHVRTRSGGGGGWRDILLLALPAWPVPATTEGFAKQVPREKERWSLVPFLAPKAALL